MIKKILFYYCKLFGHKPDFTYYGKEEVSCWCKVCNQKLNVIASYPDKFTVVYTTDNTIYRNEER